MAFQRPESMRAAVYTNAAEGLENVIHVDQKPTPTVPAGSTLIKVAYASLNPVDYKIAESFAHHFYKSPRTPGLDFSGTTATGQRVMGNASPAQFGALAEYVVLKKGFVPISDSVPLNQAAAVGVTTLTAYQCIVPYGPRKIFINGGSGGTGTAGIQIAKAIGAHVVTSCSTANIALCKELGADEVIDYTKSDLMTELRKHQFDHIVDNVFQSPEIYWSCHEFLKPGGKYVNIGGEPSMALFFEMLKVYLIPGLLGGGKRSFQFTVTDIEEQDLKALADWMAEGKVKTVIDEEFDLDDIARAYAKLKKGRTKGKIVVKIGTES